MNGKPTRSARMRARRKANDQILVSAWVSLPVAAELARRAENANKSRGEIVAAILERAATQ